MGRQRQALAINGFTAIQFSALSYFQGSFVLGTSWSRTQLSTQVPQNIDC
jgi:hypothetical protein